MTDPLEYERLSRERIVAMRVAILEAVLRAQDRHGATTREARIATAECLGHLVGKHLPKDRRLMHIQYLAGLIGTHAALEPETDGEG